MFSLISLNDNVGSKFTHHAEKVATANVILALIAGLMAYNLMGVEGSFLPISPTVGYVVSGLMILFIFDAIRYALLHQKKPIQKSIPTSPRASLENTTVTSKTPVTRPTITPQAFPDNLATKLPLKALHVSFSNIHKNCSPENWEAVKQMISRMIHSDKEFHKEMIFMLTEIDKIFALPDDALESVTEQRKKSCVTSIAKVVNQCENGWHSTISDEYNTLYQPSSDKAIDFFTESYISLVFNSMQQPLSMYREFSSMDFHINGLNPFIKFCATQLMLSRDSRLLSSSKNDQFIKHWQNWFSENGFVADGNFDYLMALFLSGYNRDQLIEYVMNRVNDKSNIHLRSELLNQLSDKYDHLDIQEFYTEVLEIERDKKILFVPKSTNPIEPPMRTYQLLTKRAIELLLEQQLNTLDKLHTDPRYAPKIQLYKEFPERFWGICKFNFSETQWLTNRHLSYFFSHLQKQNPNLYVLDNELLIEPENILQQVNLAIANCQKDSKRYIAFPLQTSKNHWTLLFIDRGLGTVEFYDSKANYGNQAEINECLRNIVILLSRKDSQPYRVIRKIDQSIQPDGYQCGPWVLYFLTERLKPGGFAHTFSETIDMRAFRSFVKETLITNIVTGVQSIEIIPVPEGI